MGIGESLRRMEEGGTAKAFLAHLEQGGMSNNMHMLLHVFRDMDWLRKNMEMVSVQIGCIRERAAGLPDGMGKEYAVNAVHAAEEGLVSAGDHFRRMEDLVGSGMGRAVNAFRNGNGSALEKPFPVHAVEKEAKSMMEVLEAAFVSVDIGLGKTEEAEGMLLQDGRYWIRSNGGLVDGSERPDTLGLLWTFRTLDELLAQTGDAAYWTASSVDAMRPKAHSIVKRKVLVPGHFWEMEKEKEKLEKRYIAAAPKTGKDPGKEKGPAAMGIRKKPAAKGRASLRQRLKAAEEASSRMCKADVKQKEKGMVGEAQR